VRLRIGTESGTARVTDGRVRLADGELGLGPCEPSWPLRAGGRRRYFEVFVQGGSAAERFAAPASGTRIALMSVAGRG
jgi:hypothetical protein